jgi:hypothetical protein
MEPVGMERVLKNNADNGRSPDAPEVEFGSGYLARNVSLN